MDRLQGYGTNGYDYRKAAIERNNSSRLKWMVSEAKKSAEKREQDEKNSQTTSFINKTSSLSELKKDNNIPKYDNKNDKMFRPNEVNRFNNFKNGMFE